MLISLLIQRLYVNPTNLGAEQIYSNNRYVLHEHMKIEYKDTQRHDIENDNVLHNSFAPDEERIPFPKLHWLSVCTIEKLCQMYAL